MMITAALSNTQAGNKCKMADLHSYTTQTSSYRYYPYGSYFDSCSDISWIDYGLNGDPSQYGTTKTEFAANCKKHDGSSVHNQFSPQLCCVGCLNDQPYSSPFEHSLKNVDGILTCDDPVSPIPRGQDHPCPGYCKCKFPFTFFDVTYNNCTTFGNTAKPWCEVEEGCGGTAMIGPYFGRYWSTDYCPATKKVRTSQSCLTLTPEG